MDESENGECLSHRIEDTGSVTGDHEPCQSSKMKRRRPSQYSLQEDTGLLQTKRSRLISDDGTALSKLKKPGSRPSMILKHGFSSDSVNVPNPEFQKQPDERRTSNQVMTLLNQIAYLEAENRRLKGNGMHGTGIPFEVFHEIAGINVFQPETYTDEPFWEMVEEEDFELRSYFPIKDLEGYIKRKGNIAFTVLKTYTSPPEQKVRMQLRQAYLNAERLPRPKPSGEMIRLNSPTMLAAMSQFVTMLPDFKEYVPKFDVREELTSPYLLWYHYGSLDLVDQLVSPYREHIKELAGWISRGQSELYDHIKEQFSRNRVTMEAVQFLIKPGDVIVTEENESNRGPQAYVAVSWPWCNGHRLIPRKTPKECGGKRKEGDIDVRYSCTWKLNCWRYAYDGTLYECPETITIEMEVGALNEEIEIRELGVYPLRHASRQTQQTLQNRGEVFWGCRYQRYVSYENEHTDFNGSERFMIDIQVYRQQHGDFELSKDKRVRRKVDDAVLQATEPPSGSRLYVLPESITGFNMRTKKWALLMIDRIQDVQWNKLSFEHLVIPPETKELIHALVTNQIDQEQNTDIIENKGNGLIILLHGAPGTGKTFTAESVAELAEKPLFRLTCGDIGTQPEQVEKYLELVPRLAQLWKCVVLLDEADVFLEQRTLTDLGRNAIVSVLLRVLEYYQGIMILTSNRIGTFDEAFHSRIQLSLHYDNLGKGQRHRVWKNFIKRLKDLDDGTRNPRRYSSNRRGNTMPDPVSIDFGDIECYLDELAGIEMNGRQIRNTITTARQLAKFKAEPLNYGHLRHVIKVSGKFVKYLNEIHEGLSEDQMARDIGNR